MVTELRGGLLVTNAALALALSLEARGHVITVRDGKIVVSDGSRLSADDRTAIGASRLHLLAIASYTAPGVEP